jgi:hypothetical protein
LTHHRINPLTMLPWIMQRCHAIIHCLAICSTRVTLFILMID